MSRTSAFTLGLITAVLAAIGLGFAVFGPATYSYGTNWIDAGSRSLWDAGIGSIGVLLFLAIVVLGVAGLLSGAYLRSRSGNAAALTLLWGSAIVLLVMAMLTFPGRNPVFVPSELHTDSADSCSVGVYLTPAVAMAFLTALIETVIHAEPSGTGRQRPPSPA